MKVLITAGATWSKIDDIRIFTNRFTGKTGMYLAEILRKKGHSVTLLINPHCTGKIKGDNIIYYRYFDEFKDKVFLLLKRKRFDIIIHSAAVSDYKVKKIYKGKIASTKKSLKLELVPVEKVIKAMRLLAKGSLLIQFKLEPWRRGLIDAAYKSLNFNSADFVVANALGDLHSGYKGFIIDRGRKVIKIDSRASLAKEINKIISAKGS